MVKKILFLLMLAMFLWGCACPCEKEYAGCMSEKNCHYVAKAKKNFLRNKNKLKAENITLSLPKPVVIK